MYEADGPDSGPSEDQVIGWAEHNAHADDAPEQDGEPQPVCPHGRDAECLECEDEESYARNLRFLVGQLTDGLSTAERGIRLAATAVESLTGNAVYDIELAEGPEGSDARDDLQAAIRLLRNVNRIAQWRTGLLDGQK
ncbi:MAG: hypothetical protein JWO67_2261 [Streptosporangiaceae bacterium]|nr:hypothetical protein [Streptosporangiaceae bacterium]